MEVVILLDKDKSISSQLDELIKKNKEGYQKALEETARYVFNRYMSIMVKTTHDTPSALKKAVKITLKSSSNNASMHVWIGANKVPFHYFGTPVQSGSSVSISASNGVHVVDNAFVTRLNGKPMVFKRAGSQRLPIRLQKKEIAKEIRPDIESSSTEFMNYFLKSLERHVFKKT